MLLGPKDLGVESGSGATEALSCNANIVVTGSEDVALNSGKENMCCGASIDGSSGKLGRASSGGRAGAGACCGACLSDRLSASMAAQSHAALAILWDGLATERGANGTEAQRSQADNLCGP